MPMKKMPDIVKIEGIIKKLSEMMRKLCRVMNTRSQ